MNVIEEVITLRETIEIQTQGLMKMLQIQAQHGAMLKEILAACTAEPEQPSPLVELIQHLVKAIDGQSAALARIETALTRTAR